MNDHFSQRIRYHSLVLTAVTIGLFLIPLHTRIQAVEQTPKKSWNTDSILVSYDDDWSTANEITIGINYTNILHSKDPIDWWKVFANFTQLITVELWLPYWVKAKDYNYHDFDLFIYDSQRNELNSSTGSSNHEVVSVVAAASSWYFIEVRHYSGFGVYLLTVEITERAKTDDFWWDATPIDNETYSDWLDSASDAVDWFSLKLNTTVTIWVNLTFSRDQLDLICRIYDEKQNLLVESSGFGDVEVANAVAYAPGHYYLEIVAIRGVGAYTLRVELTSGGESDNYWWASPTPITAGNYSGQLDPGAADPSDWFFILLRPADTVQIEITFLKTELDIDARFYDQDFRILDESTGYGGREEILTVVPALEFYYLELDSVWGAGNYSLTLEITSATSISSGTYLGALDAWQSPVGAGTWFTFQLDSAKVAKVRVEFPSNRTNIDCYLYRYDVGLQWVDGSLGDNNTEEVYGFSSTVSTWYLLVEARWGAGNYSLTLEIIDIPLIELGTYTGFLNESKPDDWFGIKLQSGDFLTASLLSNRTDFDVELFSPAGSWLTGSYLGLSHPEKVQRIAKTSGIWGIRIFRCKGSGSYQLMINTSRAELVPPGLYSGVLNASFPEMLYGIELKQGDMLFARITMPDRVNFNLELLNPNGVWITGSFRPHGPDEVSQVASLNGTYLLHISRYVGAGQYNLNIVLRPDTPPPSDLAGDSPNQARRIIAGRYSDALDEITDHHDYYVLWLEAGDILCVTVNGWTPPVDFDLEVLTSDLSLIQGSWDMIPVETVEVTVSVSGYYYLHIYSISGNSTYNLLVHVKSGITPIPDLAGNNVTTARSVLQGVVYKDYLSEKYDIEDYYSIQLTEGANMTLRIRGWDVNMTDFELQVLNSTFDVLATTWSPNPEENVTLTAPSTGIFYIRVFSIVGSGWYELSIEIETGSNTTQTTSPKTTITTSEFAFTGIPLVGVFLVLVFSFYISHRKRHRDKP